MKKWSVVLLCALMVLSGCGGGNSKDAQSSAAEETLKAAEAKMDERTSYLKTYHTEGTTLELNADKDGLQVVESNPYDSCDRNLSGRERNAKVCLPKGIRI